MKRDKQIGFLSAIEKKNIFTWLFNVTRFIGDGGFKYLLSNEINFMCYSLLHFIALLEILTKS